MTPSFTVPPVPARPRRPLALLGDALRRPGGRRSVSLLSAVLFLAGVVMFAYPSATDLYSHNRQGTLRGTFDDPGFRETYRLRKVEVGQGLTRLRIPKLDVDVLVVEGTTPAALRAGAGHYADTPLPGEAGNVAIAGHRTTYGRPFNRLDEMAAGDTVLLETPFAEYTYQVTPPFDGHLNPWPVQPTDFGVVEQEHRRPGSHPDDVSPEGKRSAATHPAPDARLHPQRAATVDTGVTPGGGRPRPAAKQRDRRRGHPRNSPRRSPDSSPESAVPPWCSTRSAPIPLESSPLTTVVPAPRTVTGLSADWRLDRSSSS